MIHNPAERQIAYLEMDHLLWSNRFTQADAWRFHALLGSQKENIIKQCCETTNFAGIPPQWVAPSTDPAEPNQYEWPLLPRLALFAKLHLLPQELINTEDLAVWTEIHQGLNVLPLGMALTTADREKINPAFFEQSWEKYKRFYLSTLLRNRLEDTPLPPYIKQEIDACRQGKGNLMYTLLTSHRLDLTSKKEAAGIIERAYQFSTEPASHHDLHLGQVPWDHFTDERTHRILRQTDRWWELTDARALSLLFQPNRKGKTVAGNTPWATVAQIPTESLLPYYNQVSEYFHKLEEAQGWLANLARAKIQAGAKNPSLRAPANPAL